MVIVKALVDQDDRLASSGDVGEVLGGFVEADDGSGDWIEVEDRSACDLEGMDLVTYGEFLRVLLPGWNNGYSVGFDLPDSGPTGPTLARPGSSEKIAILRRRASKRMALHHPLDSRKNPLPAPNET